MARRVRTTIPIKQARRANKRSIRTIISTPGNGISVLNWPVGIGKTHTIVNETAKRGKRLLWLAPTHELAIQSRKEYEAKGLRTAHIASRSYLAKKDGFECWDPKKVELAQRHGYPAQLCNKCPRKRRSLGAGEQGEPKPGYTPCEYYEQFEAAREADVLFAVHAHVGEWLYDIAQTATRDLTIIDESPINALFREVKPIEATMLTVIRQALYQELEMLQNEMNEALAALRTTPKKWFTIAGLSLVVDEVRDRMGLFKVFDDLAWGRSVSFGLLFSKRDDAIGAWIDLARRMSIENGIAKQAGLEDEWAHLAIPFSYEDAFRLAWARRRYDPTGTSFIPRSLPENKTIILDATASKVVYDAFIAASTQSNRPYEFMAHPLVEQPYCHTTQITNASYGVSRLESEEVREALIQVIRRLRQRHPGPALFVCHKTHKQTWQKAFFDDPLVEFAHFGELRGLNKWSEYPSQFIVGTLFVPDIAIANFGKMIGMEVEVKDLEAAADKHPSPLISRKGQRAVTYRRVYKGLDFHTAALQMTAQGEVTQGVRLRLYNKPSCGRQYLYVFSNVALKGIYADELTTLDDLAAELGAREQEKGKMAHAAIEAWFKEQPLGYEFRTSDIKAMGDRRYFQEWLRVAGTNGWVEKRGRGRGSSYVKLGEPA